MRISRPFIVYLKSSDILYRSFVLYFAANQRQKGETKMGLIATAIKEKLTKNFNPVHLEVIDNSHQHAGHAGAAQHASEHGSGESHFSCGDYVG